MRRRLQRLTEDDVARVVARTDHAHLGLDARAIVGIRSSGVDSLTTMTVLQSHDHRGPIDLR